MTGRRLLLLVCGVASLLFLWRGLERRSAGLRLRSDLELRRSLLSGLAHAGGSRAGTDANAAVTARGVAPLPAEPPAWESAPVLRGKSPSPATTSGLDAVDAETRQETPAVAPHVLVAELVPVPPARARALAVHGAMTVRDGTRVLVAWGERFEWLSQGDERFGWELVHADSMSTVFVHCDSRSDVFWSPGR